MDFCHRCGSLYGDMGCLECYPIKCELCHRDATSKFEHKPSGKIISTCLFCGQKCRSATSGEKIDRDKKFRDRLDALIVSKRE